VQRHLVWRLQYHLHIPHVSNGKVAMQAHAKRTISSTSDDAPLETRAQHIKPPLHPACGQKRARLIDQHDTADSLTSATASGHDGDDSDDETFDVPLAQRRVRGAPGAAVATGSTTVTAASSDATSDTCATRPLAQRRVIAAAPLARKALKLSGAAGAARGRSPSGSGSDGVLAASAAFGGRQGSRKGEAPGPSGLQRASSVLSGSAVAGAAAQPRPPVEMVPLFDWTQQVRAQQTVLLSVSNVAKASVCLATCCIGCLSCLIASSA
jgi:hypothetical protein